MFESELNVNDILRTDLMPTFFIEDDAAAVSLDKNVDSVNGSIDAALSTLDYHR